MNINERIELLRECGMADQTAYEDMKTIVELLDSRFHITLTEENGGSMITHMSAVFRRSITGEAVAPMAGAVAEELYSNSTYPRGTEMLQAIESVIQHRLSTQEQDYILLHLCTLLYGNNKNNAAKEKEEEQ